VHVHAVAPTEAPASSTAAVAAELGQASGRTKAASRHRRWTPAVSERGCGPAFALSADRQGGSRLFGRPRSPVEGVLARVYDPPGNPARVVRLALRGIGKQKLLL
jgi:hypothetical protein